MDRPASDNENLLPDGYLPPEHAHTTGKDERARRWHSILCPFAASEREIERFSRAFVEASGAPARRVAYKPRKPTPARTELELQREREAHFRKAFDEQLLSLDDLEPQRIGVAWRIVRELARIFGAIEDDEPIGRLVPPVGGTDPWRAHRTFAFTKNRLPRAFAVERILDVLNKEGYKLGILPPAIHTGDLDPETLLPRESYDPATDKIARAYVAIVQTIADYLEIPLGSENDRDCGRYGLAGLLDVRTIRGAFPSPEQITDYEEWLTDETFDCVVKHGAMQTTRWLMRQFGLKRDEAASMLKLAKRYGKKVMLTEDLEEERALALARLEDLRRRAKNAFNIREEVNILKQIALVQGLTKVEPDDTASDFVNVIRQVSAARAARKQLPG